MLAPYEGTWSTGIPPLTEEQCTMTSPAPMPRALRARSTPSGTPPVTWCSMRSALEAAARTRSGCATGSSMPSFSTPAIFARLARLGIIASMQPLHATSDMLIAERYWGARCAGAYAWKSLLEAGTALAFGSDCPVEIADPLAGIHAAVTRRRADGSPGPDGWRPEQPRAGLLGPGRPLHRRPGGPVRWPADARRTGGRACRRNAGRPRQNSARVCESPGGSWNGGFCCRSRQTRTIRHLRRQYPQFD